ISEQNESQRRAEHIKNVRPPLPSAGTPAFKKVHRKIGQTLKGRPKSETHIRRIIEVKHSKTVLDPETDQRITVHEAEAARLRRMGATDEMRVIRSINGRLRRTPSPAVDDLQQWVEHAHRLVKSRLSIATIKDIASRLIAKRAHPRQRAP